MTDSGGSGLTVDGERLDDAWYTPWRLKRALQIAFVTALTVMLVWLFLRNADLRDVWRILQSANIGWVLIAGAVNLSTLFFRSIRWRTILDPDDPPSFYSTFFANAVGYMLSTVLPIRAADVARPALLAKRSGKRFSTALGTVLTEKILDFLSVLSLFVYFSALRWRQFTSNPETEKPWRLIVQPATIVASVLIVTLVSFIIGVLLFADKVRVAHGWLARLIPARFRSSWMNFFDMFVQSLHTIRQRHALLRVIGCTVTIWACLTLQFTFTALALHQDLPFDSTFFITGATTLSLVVPTPAGIGGVHKVAQFVLTRFYGMDLESAVAAAVLFHLVGTLPCVILGLGLVMREGIRLRDLEKEVEG
jgi:uncharacterized protein (TIRG00374 family)